MAFDIFLSIGIICVYIFIYWKMHNLIAKNINNKPGSIIVGTCIGIALSLLFISVTHSNEILRTTMTKKTIWLMKGWINADFLLVLMPAFYASFRIPFGDEKGEDSEAADSEKQNGRPHKTFGQAVYDTVTSPIFAFIVVVAIVLFLSIKFFGLSEL